MKLFGRKKRDDQVQNSVDLASDEGVTDEVVSDFELGKGDGLDVDRGDLAASKDETADETPERLSLLSRLLSRKGNSKPGTSDDALEIEVDGNEVSGLLDIKSSGHVDMSFDGDRILEIGRKKFALGLLWDTSSSDDKIRLQAESLSDAQTSINLYAPFKTGGQYGFGSTDKGDKPGMKAGVTCFDPKQMGQSWLAAFRLGASSNFYWVVAQRDGSVYEDQILESEDDARAVFLENLQAPNWQRTIAPEEWELGGVQNILISDAINVDVGVGLKAVNPFKTYLPRIIAISVLTIVCIVGWFVYQNWVEEQERQAAELERQRRDAVSVSPSDYPWFDSPDFGLFIGECFPKMDEVLRVVPGWEQEQISCRLDEKSKLAEVDTTWLNRGGTVPWLVASFSPDEIQPQIKIDGTIAGVAHSIEFGVQTDILAEAWTPEKIEKILNRRIQTVGVAVQMTPRGLR